MSDIVLYGGKVKLHFNPKAHKYTCNGRSVPSVTSILGNINKPFLMSWAVNETARTILEKWMPYRTYDPDEINTIVREAKGARQATSLNATEIGREAHEWIEQYITFKIRGVDAYQDLPTHPKVRLSIEAFLQWERNHDIEYLHSERRCYSLEMNYSGTVDLIARVDGHMAIIDFKTSKSVYPDYYLQGAAYAHALWEEGIIPTMEDTKIIIVRIPKDGGELEVGTRTDTMELLEVFRGVRALHEYLHQYEKENPYGIK